ncbi:pseudouridine synthase [Papiliotrema laurentii]|uniref:Pseudouridine synthase n=1 Tax=Papiliotrema laurentii TaxID=5418 RepID=A0AAD9CYJ1_PAPLA|nr:pseudouridine synthase [Papiliotrema laurentii]
MLGAGRRRLVSIRFMSQYANLSRDELVAKLQALELANSPTSATSDAGPSTHHPTAPPPTTTAAVSDIPVDGKTMLKGKGKPLKVKPSKAFEFNQHPTRHVALLVAYHGWPYSGLAIQNEQDDTPTVEAELLKALEKTRLIEQGKGWDGCGFSRCGRTDRGVSGAGQVVSLWVRSNRKEPGMGWRPSIMPPPPPKTDEHGRPIVARASPLGEHAYPRLLNNVLPPSIRVLGWSPIPEEFDARFSCTTRHYKYAFHHRPTPASPELDLDLMRRAVRKMLGEHDFRNFCRLDGSKQIESHSRRVIDAWFNTDEAYPGMVVFNLIGSAFLWHQVRHIIAVLFLVGSKLEAPELVDELLDVSKCPSRPAYQMGHPLPLTLYECGFEGLDWRAGGYDGPTSGITADELVMEDDSRAKLERGLEELRQEAELRAWQVGNAVNKMREIYGKPAQVDTSSLFPTGGGEMLSMSTYRPVMSRSRGDTPEEVNRKWREKNPDKVRRGVQGVQGGDE